MTNEVKVGWYLDDHSYSVYVEFESNRPGDLYPFIGFDETNKRMSYSIEGIANGGNRLDIGTWSPTREALQQWKQVKFKVGDKIAVGKYGLRATVEAIEWIDEFKRQDKNILGYLLRYGSGSKGYATVEEYEDSFPMKLYKEPLLWEPNEREKFYHARIYQNFKTPEECKLFEDFHLIRKELSMCEGAQEFVGGEENWYLQFSKRGYSAQSTDYELLSLFGIYFDSETNTYSAAKNIGEQRMLKVLKWWNLIP